MHSEQLGLASFESISAALGKIRLSGEPSESWSAERSDLAIGLSDAGDVEHEKQKLHSETWGSEEELPVIDSEDAYAISANNNVRDRKRRSKGRR